MYNYICKAKIEFCLFDYYITQCIEKIKYQAATFVSTHENNKPWGGFLFLFSETFCQNQFISCKGEEENGNALKPLLSLA